MAIYEEIDLYGTQYGIPDKRGSLLPRKRDRYGNRNWKVTTGPVVEPISVDEVKDIGRIDGDYENNLIRGFIASVRIAAEKYMGRALITQTLTMHMDWWPGEVIELPRPPAQSITSVVTLDEDDAVITAYDAATYYYLVQHNVNPKLVWRQSVSQPVNTQRDYQGYRIIWVAGYGDDDTDVPDDIRLGLMYWALALYEKRIPDLKKPPPEAVGLLRRIPRI